MVRVRPALHFLIVLAFLTLVLAPWSTWLGARVDLAHVLGAPSWTHPLGTDSLGRDLVGRVAEALRYAVLPLWGVVALTTVVGIFAGCAAIAFGGRVVALLDAGAAAVASVPVGLAVFAWAAVQAEAGLGAVLPALAALFAARSYLQIRDLYRHDSLLAYWTAHAALGGSLWVRLGRYGLLTGWRRALLETLGFHLRAAVAIEASLSYLGFGVQEPKASFGNMLAAHFELYVKGQWYVLGVIVAGLALTTAFPGSLLCSLLPTQRTIKAGTP